jgi:HlyD family secretion protein
VNYKIGEQATGAKPALKLMAEEGFELDLDVAETDIAKIQLNNPAAITLDAYGDGVKLEGRVSFIEPAETVIQGVIYYKVKINFVAPDIEIKPGMTATAEIVTARRDAVLQVPLRAVLEADDGRKYVKVLDGKQPREVDVKTGLVGDGGLVEVLSGVVEGDDIITFTKNGKK